MTNARLALPAAGAVLMLVAMVLLAARAIDRVDDPPSLEEWARISCTAMSDPLTDESWEDMRNRFAASLAGLQGTPPDGTAEFQAALSEGVRTITVELDSLARHEADDPPAASDLTDLRTAVGDRDEQVLLTAPSLSPDARAAIEAVPGCAGRLPS